MSLVKVAFAHEELATLKVDLLALAVTAEEIEKGKIHGPSLKALDKALGGVLGEALAELEFDAKPSAELTLHTHGKLAATRVVVLGLGKKAKIDRDTARQAAARAVKTADRTRAATVALVFPFEDSQALLEAAAEGAQLGAYRFDKYLSERKPQYVN